MGIPAIDVVPADEPGVWFVEGDDLTCGAFKADTINAAWHLVTQLTF
ncbi:MAG: hypothetical protein ABR517_11745 [Thermoanaerobaculia bacterium]